MRTITIKMCELFLVQMVWYFDETSTIDAKIKNFIPPVLATRKKKLCRSYRFEGTSGKDA